MRFSTLLRTPGNGKAQLLARVVLRSLTKTMVSTKQGRKCLVTLEDGSRKPKEEMGMLEWLIAGAEEGPPEGYTL